ncbi:hypothetical protein JIN85_16890 [Luteolibacter pohnpeiensis]|uniref:Uncharacterized protein n=1 Tax=Luteolibacter pohnpeiensis TaxID=454153 RepID=A0A934SA59_9BACT|nr:hypothetical protein [Luteolibacter pohnpeiensis]MBK1884099.1 hypothetical protein [Luteolibacter pohnpeiensis]
MAKLALSQRIFAGAFVYFAIEAAATSDTDTKPAAASPLWLEIGCVSILKHNMLTFEQAFSCPDADRGWSDKKQVFHTGDTFDLTTEEVSELYHRLSFGVGAAMAEGVAQTPFTSAERMVRGWIKIQHRQATGNDRSRLDIFCEIRLKEDPAMEKKVTIPVFELYVVKSTLNSVELPAAA